MFDWRRRSTLLVLGGILVVGLAGWGAFGPPASGSDPTATPSPNLTFRPAPDNAGIHYVSDDSGAAEGSAGVYATDYNNDGWTDLLAVGNNTGPVLFENTGGQFERTGVFPTDDGPVHTALFVDYDVDGWQDLILFRDGAEPVLLENRNGTFVRRSGAFDTTLSYPVSATAADFDGDGCPDLFVAQSQHWGHVTPKGWSRPRIDVTDDNGNPNVYLEGNCSAFDRRPGAIPPATRWSLAVSAADLAGGPAPDVYVANDYNNDTLLVNDGSGQFAERVLAPSTDRNGMSSDVLDVNRDGRPDVFVTNVYLPIENASDIPEYAYQVIHDMIVNRFGDRNRGNTLLVRRANGTFANRAGAYGVRNGGWGWATVTADFENDGDADLFHTTSRVATLHPADPIYTYPMLFERRGQNFTRLDASARGFEETDGRGAVQIDYDNDGDRDVVMAQFDAAVRVYENTADALGWIDVRIPTAGNGTALGTEVRVTAGGRTQYRWRNARGDLLSQEPRVLHVGVGTHQQVALTVEWPNGTTRTYRHVSVNRTVTVLPGRLSVPAQAAG